MGGAGDIRASSEPPVLQQPGGVTALLPWQHVPAALCCVPGEFHAGAGGVLFAEGVSVPTLQPALGKLLLSTPSACTKSLGTSRVLRHVVGTLLPKRGTATQHRLVPFNAFWGLEEAPPREPVGASSAAFSLCSDWCGPGEGLELLLPARCVLCGERLEICNSHSGYDAVNPATRSAGTGAGVWAGGPVQDAPALPVTCLAEQGVKPAASPWAKGSTCGGYWFGP